MCGLAGILHTLGGDAAPTADARRGAVYAMMDRLTHRGPDGAGFWDDAHAGIALGHRRLAVVDVSPAGAQPMHAASGRYILAYNGEIYGHMRLAKELEHAGARFRGHSDTEVLLAAIDLWGVETTLARVHGMFAFALWDRHTRQLTLARDRAGKKPLYIATTPHGIAFASELGALMAVDGFARTIDRTALALYLTLQTVPAPFTVFATAWKLPPARTLTLTPSAPPSDLAHTIATAPAYWDVGAVAAGGAADNSARAAAANDLETVIGDAVEDRLVADVPLGAFLSGGIDSTTVVALMRERAGRRVQTFTIGFNEAGYDEATHARAVAQHLDTEHHELYLSGQEARDVIADLPAIYSEPFADASQIPTCLISRFARQSVTVALSGDGGDECFGGYNRHVHSAQIARIQRVLPAPARRTLNALTRLLPPTAWDRLLAPLGQPQAGDRLYKLTAAIAASSPAAAYAGLQTIWPAAAHLVPGADDRAASYPGFVAPALDDVTARMMLCDFTHYLPDGPLHKVDRASMSVGLEVRAPLLDTRVIEAAWRLPMAAKIHAGKGKWPLRALLQKRLPAALIQRPKQGFSVPIDAWLRGPLREWAETLLEERALAADGLLNPAPIRTAWQRHLSGRENRAQQLWAVLMLQAWRHHWMTPHSQRRGRAHG